MFLRYIYFQALFISALIAGASAAVHAPSYGYAPEYYCRDTNTSVYAEVCVLRSAC